MAKTSKNFTFSLRSRWARRQRRYSWHNGHQRTPRTPWTSWRRRRNGTWRSSGSQRGAWFGRKTWASGLSRSSWAPRQAWVWRQWGLRCKYLVLRQSYFQKSCYTYIYSIYLKKSYKNRVNYYLANLVLYKNNGTVKRNLSVRNLKLDRYYLWMFYSFVGISAKLAYKEPMRIKLYPLISI